MNIISYIKKAVLLFKFTFIYSNNFIYPFFYLFRLQQSQLSNCRKILFYFNNAEFMHIGDHIFFIKTIKVFMQHGYSIDVYTTAVMANIFSKIGINVVQNISNNSDYDLLVSRFELFVDISNNKKLAAYPLLLVNITKNLTMPIADDLLNNFAVLFNLSGSKVIDGNIVDYYSFSLLANAMVAKKFNLNVAHSYYIVCPYCDSNFFLATPDKVGRILAFAKSRIQEEQDTCMLLVGTSGDKERDKHNYAEHGFIDLRGQTTIEDICSLANLSNIKGFIGFDNFIMHVFSIVHKPSFVVYRGRIGAKRSEIIKQSHINLHTGEHFVILI